MPDITTYIASGQPTLYAGPILFRTGRVDTPLITMIGNRRRNWNGEKFIIGQTCANPVAVQNSAVSEADTLTPPAFKPVGREQATNVIEIHTASVKITDYSEGNRALLSGPNLAGQVGNPLNELDFQRHNQQLQFLQNMEWALINSKYQDRNGDLSKPNKTRGLDEAIKTNVLDIKGNEMSWQYLNELMISIADNGGSTAGLVLGCDTLTATQLAIEAKSQHYEVVSGVSNINGIATTVIKTIKGTVTLVEMRYLPADGATAFLLNVPMLGLVEQPTKFGNYYWTNMGRTGLGREEMFYAAFGLDYGAEMAHGKITGIARGYTPYKGTRVFITNPAVANVDENAQLSGVNLDSAQVGVATSALTMEYTGEPSGAATLAYQWQTGKSAIGVFTDIEGANAATYTPTAEDEGLFLRCVVTASGTAEGTVNSNSKKVVAAAD